MKKILGCFVILLPWKIKRWILVKVWKYQLHPTSRIGFSWIFPNKLKMDANSTIGHFNVAVHLDEMVLGANSIISRSNWITGFPSGTTSPHFSHQKERESRLLIGKHSSITKHHHLDCTNLLKIGDFVTIAGYYSQFLTHSIDIYENRQNSKSIIIGDYSFLGTNVVVLGGAILPAYSILGAKALLNKAFTEEFILYSGVPAKAVKEIDHSAKYFHRQDGFVY